MLFCNWLLLRVQKTQATPISPHLGTFWGFFSKFPTSTIWGSLSSCKRTGYKNENNDRENFTTLHIHSLSFIPSDTYTVKRLIMVFVAVLFKYFKLGRSVLTTAALLVTVNFVTFSSTVLIIRPQTLENMKKRFTEFTSLQDLYNFQFVIKLRIHNCQLRDR